MLKLGDKVYCYFSFGNFKKGNYYEITYDNGDGIIGINPGLNEAVFLYLEVDPELNWCKDYFYDYFYDHQQLRQKKLKELQNAQNESRR